jgi:hypothetical protein
MQNIGDTKAGLLIGTDRYGNKFYENNEELPCPCLPLPFMLSPQVRIGMLT